jgi:hypothetical protein
MRLRIGENARVYRAFSPIRAEYVYRILCQKNILILVEEKKYDSEFLSYSLMLNSGSKIGALRDKKNKYSNSCDVRKKNSQRNKKHNPPTPLFKLNGSSR